MWYRISKSGLFVENGANRKLLIDSCRKWWMKILVGG